MGDCEHLCGWGKKRIEADFERLALIVGQPRFVCRNCGRATSDATAVCKPRALPRAEPDRDERRARHPRRRVRFKRLKKALEKKLRKRVKALRGQLIEQLHAELELLRAELLGHRSERPTRETKRLAR